MVEGADEEEQPERKPASRPANPREASLRRRRVVRAAFGEGIFESPRGEFVPIAGPSGASDAEE